MITRVNICAQITDKGLHNPIANIQAMTLHIHTHGRFNNHTTPSLYRISVMATSVVGVMKMRNIEPRVGIEPTYLTFRTTVLNMGRMLSSGNLVSAIVSNVALNVRGEV